MTIIKIRMKEMVSYCAVIPAAETISSDRLKSKKSRVVIRNYENSMIEDMENVTSTTVRKVLKNNIKCVES